MPFPPGPSRVRLAPVLAVALAVLLIGGCDRAPEDHGRLAVVASTTQLSDLVRAIGGEHVRLHAILKPNSDPHEYEPRPRDVLAVGESRVVFVSGYGLDGWMHQIVRAAGYRRALIDVGARIPHPLVRVGDTDPDPHWWHDPRNVEAAVLVMRDALAEADPAHAESYERAAAVYRARVRALDTVIARCLASIAPERRKLVTNHDALDYFARRYGLEVVGTVIPSQVGEAQPSAGALAKLAALVRRERVPAIFPEQSVNARVAHALAAQTGVRADTRLYADTLGPPGSPGSTYLGMEAANADAIARALSGGGRGCAVRAAETPGGSPAA